MFTKKFWTDVLERAVWTFLQVLGAVEVVFDESFGKTVGAAAMAALISAMKGVLASRVGDKQSAATLPVSQ